MLKLFIIFYISDKLSANLFRVEVTVDKCGGFLEIPDTGVSLEIPPGALEEEYLIKMRIITNHSDADSGFSFASHSSAIVELLPSDIKLHKPVKLTLPHCLVLKSGCDKKATIYSSHHEEGNDWIFRMIIETKTYKGSISVRDHCGYIVVCLVRMIVLVAP